MYKTNYVTQNFKWGDSCTLLERERERDRERERERERPVYLWVKVSHVLGPLPSSFTAPSYWKFERTHMCM